MPRTKDSRSHQPSSMAKSSTRENPSRNLKFEVLSKGGQFSTPTFPRVTSTAHLIISAGILGCGWLWLMPSSSVWPTVGRSATACLVWCSLASSWMMGLASAVCVGESRVG